MNNYQEAIKVKSDFFSVARAFLLSRGFIEINTPKISFMPTDQDDHLFKLDYFGNEAYLTQSPQFYKQAYIVNGISSVFEIAPVFRAEPRVTKHHLSEFTSLDVESETFGSLEDILIFESNLIMSITQRLSQLHDVRAIESFEVIPYETVKKLLGLKEDEPIRRNHEKEISALSNADGIFVTYFPENQRVFYYDSRHGTSISFDLIVDGLEITSGGIRTTSKEELIRKMKKDGIDPLRYLPYLELFDAPVNIHGGFAIGVERLIAKYLRMSDVIEVNPFGKKPDIVGEKLVWEK